VGRPTSTPLASVAASTPRPQASEPSSCAVSAWKRPARDAPPVQRHSV